MCHQPQSFPLDWWVDAHCWQARLSQWLLHHLYFWDAYLTRGVNLITSELNLFNVSLGHPQLDKFSYRPPSGPNMVEGQWLWHCYAWTLCYLLEVDDPTLNVKLAHRRANVESGPREAQSSWQAKSPWQAQAQGKPRGNMEKRAS